MLQTENHTYTHGNMYCYHFYKPKLLADCKFYDGPTLRASLEFPFCDTTALKFFIKIYKVFQSILRILITDIKHRSLVWSVLD